MVVSLLLSFTDGFEDSLKNEPKIYTWRLLPKNVRQSVLRGSSESWYKHDTVRT